MVRRRRHFELILCFVLGVFPCTLFPEEAMKIGDSETVYAISDFVMLESGIAEGEFIGVDPLAAGFKTYDGGNLPPHPAESIERMFTFRTKFFVDRALIGKTLFIAIGPLEYAMQVYLNGVKFEKFGEFIGRYTLLSYDARKRLLSPDLLRYGDVNELAFEIFPRESRVPMKDIFISGFAKTAGIVYWRSFFNHMFPLFTALVSFFIFIYFISLYISTGRTIRRYLLFAITCLFFSLAYVSFFSGEGVDELFLIRSSRIGLFLVSASLCLYIMELVGIFRWKWIPALYAVLFMIVPTVPLLFPPTMRGINELFGLLSNFTITPTLVFNVIAVIVLIVRQKRLANVFLLASLLIVAAAGLHDLGFIQRDDIPYCWLVIYSYFFLLLVNFAQLSTEQSVTYRESIFHLKALDEKNRSLGEMLGNIMNVTKSLSQSSVVLERSITEAIDITMKYEQINTDVKRQILSQFSNIDAIMGLLSARIESFNRKMPVAIEKQNSAIRNTYENIIRLKEHIEGIVDSTSRSNEVAASLHGLSQTSTEIVEKSRKSIEMISEHSRFIGDVMSAIDDITERTNILSINASIESAHAGNYGKGFAVVSNEIRTLANQSKTNLASSTMKIREMFGLVKNSLGLSNDVSATLGGIIEKSKLSAEMMETIEDLIQKQKSESNAIMTATDSLMEESRSILGLANEERTENEKIKGMIRELVELFGTITDSLNEQTENEKRIFGAIDNIKRVLTENLKNVEVLTRLQKESPQFHG